MRRSFMVALALALAFGVQAQQVKAPKCGKRLTSRQVVEYLASDALQGRDGGTKGDTLASEFICRQLEKLGLEPGVQKFNVKKGNISTFNVYGSVAGRSGKYIVVGAIWEWEAREAVHAGRIPLQSITVRMTMLPELLECFIWQNILQSQRTWSTESYLRHSFISVVTMGLWSAIYSKILEGTI